MNSRRQTETVLEERRGHSDRRSLRKRTGRETARYEEQMADRENALESRGHSDRRPLRGQSRERDSQI